MTLATPAPLLIVDDEKNTRDGLRLALEDEFEVYTAADLSSAKALLKAEQMAVLITDLRLGGENGMELVDFARQLPEAPVTMMMTAYGDVETAVEAMRRGAWHFVTKPLDLGEIEALSRRASALFFKQQVAHKQPTAEQQTAQQSTARPSKATSPKTSAPKVSRAAKASSKPSASPNAPAAVDAKAILGSSPQIEQLREQIAQVAPSRATVLIEGESGTGKELVAHALHAQSPRAHQPLVAVHCAALSEQLLESELFGHEKGAFTGATQQRRGRFELADDGTLFLDEIGEIAPTTQVKLLRALGERTIERVGGSQPIGVDVRVVAATNRDLWQMVLDGKFREDLYFRLAVIRLETPPLRERGADVIQLAERFLEEFCEENALPTKQLSQASLKQLSAHLWPGNVRELRTVIEHAVVMSREQVIEPESLPSSMSVRAAEPPPRSQPPRVRDEKTGPEPPFNAVQQDPQGMAGTAKSFDLREQERRLIEEALQATEGNRTQAAKLLGISRRTLQRKLGEEG